MDRLLGSRTGLVLIASMIAVLGGCNTGSRDGKPADLQWDYMSLTFEGFSSPNPQPTNLELGYWLETLESIGRVVSSSTGLRKQQSFIVVHYDRSSLFNEFLRTGPPRVGKSAVFGLAANVPLGSVLAFRIDGVVHCEQGNKQTLAGMGAHMLSHIWLEDQVGNEDTTHRIYNWLGWESDYIAASLRLENRR